MNYNRSGKNNPFYGKKHTEESKKKMSDYAKKRKPTFTGKKHSEETKDKIRNKHLGEKSRFWKGGVAHISVMHKKVVSKKGSAKKYICEFCKKRQALDWSNLDHKYTENLNDYKPLCRSCHKLWDFKHNLTRGRPKKLIN